MSDLTRFKTWHDYPYITEDKDGMWVLFADAQSALATAEARINAALLDGANEQSDIIRDLTHERDALRRALVELVECHTESAGWSMSMMANREEFESMLRRSEARIEAAVAAARAALSHVQDAGPAVDSCHAEGSDQPKCISGWRLVPEGVTNAMIDAANNVPTGIAGSPPHWQWVWDAMLAAAPIGPASASEGERSA